jgi:hypothetical protein
LPSVTFGAAGTNTKTSILHLRKKGRNAPVHHHTAFAVCQNVGFTVSTKANQRTKVANGDGDLPGILEEIHRRPANPILVKWLSDAESFDRWDAQHHASLSTEVEQRLGSKAETDVSVSDIAELVNEVADPRRWGTKEFNYIEISDIDSQTCVVYTKSIDIAVTPTRARKLVRTGDVLVSTVRPERGIVGVVGAHQDGSVCTTGLAVLRPKKIDSLALAFLLKTDFVIAQLMRNNVGIAYPAIKESCLAGVLLPVRQSELSKLERQAKEITHAEGKLYEMRKEFLATIEDFGAAWRQMSLSPTPKPHPTKQTKSHRRSDKSDSGLRDQDIFQLAEARKV